jgi:hypothetical protein
MSVCKHRLQSKQLAKLESSSAADPMAREALKREDDPLNGDAKLKQQQLMQDCSQQFGVCKCCSTCV